MAYSVESLVFRAVAGVVNTAARAANSLLEVMYPKDIGRIWEDVPASSVGGPAPTDPPSGGAADPAEGAVPPVPSAGSLTWSGWAEPAILEVLAEHELHLHGDPEREPWWWSCIGFDGEEHARFGFHYEWAEHVAPLIADRIGCDPARAALALTSLQTQ